MFRAFWRLLPYGILVVGVVAAAWVLLWAKSIGIASYRIPDGATVWRPGKQVGFMDAWNWLFSLLMLPVFLALVVATIQQTAQAFSRMHAAGMLVDRRFRPITAPRLGRLWRTLVIAFVLLSAVLGLLSMRYTLNQFDEVIGRHFDADAFVGVDSHRGSDGLALPTDVDEYDWSVAALIDRSAPGRGSTMDAAANRAFSLFVYVVYLGLFMVAFGCLMAWFVVVSAAAWLTSFDRPSIQLVPDTGSPDPRRGLEVLEGPFVCALIAVFVAYLAAYLVVLQNLFLRSQAADLGALFGDAVAEAAGQLGSDFWQSIGLLVGWVVEARADESVRSLDATLSSMGGVVVVVVVMIAVILVLRTVANRGHIRLQAHLRHQLPAIETWPMSWPRIDTLLVALVLATIALFAFRLGALLFAGMIAYCLGRMWRIAGIGAPPAQGGGTGARRAG